MTKPRITRMSEAPCDRGECVETRALVKELVEALEDVVKFVIAASPDHELADLITRNASAALSRARKVSDGR